MSAVRQRAALGQNFLRRASLARMIVTQARLEAGGRVYDLGAGTGILTAEIAATGAQTIAVEHDANLARKLRARFAQNDVTVIAADLNDVAFAAPYSVVANIPFNRTAALLKRLLFERPHPQQALLLVQREAAEKYVGMRLTLVSLLAMPWFELRIVHHFAPSDFVPMPGVETVLLHIVPRTPPWLGEDERAAWEAFVRHAFGRTKPDARAAFRKVLSNLQWRLLARDLGVAEGVLLKDLDFPQWLEIYRFYRRHAAPHRRLKATFGGSMR